jgi:hypothetical protein
MEVKFHFTLTDSSSLEVRICGLGSGALHIAAAQGMPRAGGGARRQRRSWWESVVPRATSQGERIRLVLLALHLFPAVPVQLKTLQPVFIGCVLIVAKDCPDSPNLPGVNFLDRCFKPLPSLVKFLFVSW